MSLKYEEAHAFARELAKGLGEVVAVVGETRRDHDDGEAQEFLSPDGSSIQGVLEAGIGNCRFTRFPFACLNANEMKWFVSFRGKRIGDLNPVKLAVALSAGKLSEKLGANDCSCGAVPQEHAVLEDGMIRVQFKCANCGHEGPIEWLDGDAAASWNESLTK